MSRQLKIHIVQQTSPEWWQLRCGLATASSFDRIITNVKGDRSKSADKYVYELIAQRAMPSANYFSKYGVKRGSEATEHGQTWEAKARDWYTYETGISVMQVGFVESDCGLYGGSPDGVIGLVETGRAKVQGWGEVQGSVWDAIFGTIEGGLELKCPDLDTHLEYVHKKKLPSEYRVQVHAHLANTGAAFWDFVSYHPDANGNNLRVRVEPDEFTRKVVAARDEFMELYRKIAVELAVELTPPAEAYDPATGEVYMTDDDAA